LSLPEGADDERRHDWWRFAVAAVAEPRLESVQPVLPSGKALIVGAYVLNEQQAAAGPEHPVEFAKRAVAISTQVLCKVDDQRRLDSLTVAVTCAGSDQS
jgi:hypothetical protein